MTAAILALALVAQIAACGPLDAAKTPEGSVWTQAEEIYQAARGSPPARPGIILEGTEWVLVRLEAKHLVPGSYITLSFGDGEIRGFGGCNKYRGLYETTGSTLTFPEIARTAMACPWLEGSTEQEAAYIRALTEATFFQAQKESLLIRGPNGQTLAFAPKKQEPIAPDELVGTAWQLVSMDGKRPLEGTNPTLSFHDHQRAAGHTGCRDYVASYRTTGGYFSYSVIDMVGADCPAGEALAQQEEAYATLLGAAKDYRLLGDRLEIFAGQDETLVYEPQAASAKAALMGTTWTLRAFVQRDTLGPAGPYRYWTVDLLPETELTLALGEGMAKGTAGCNTFRAIYRREGDFISFSLQALNESRCEESIMEQERRFLDLLQDVTAYRIDGSQLWLAAVNGQALVLGAGK